jgi:cytochrome b subunit of formate dehydrogenase
MFWSLCTQIASYPYNNEFFTLHNSTLMMEAAYSSEKHKYPSTGLYAVTAQKTTIWAIITFLVVLKYVIIIGNITSALIAVSPIVIIFSC